MFESRVVADASLLTDDDLYLFHEGTHFFLFDKLGAHPRTVGSTTGVNFAVWAPNAERVSVVSIDTARGAARDEGVPGTDIAACLARHGVQAEVTSSVGTTEASAGEMLLSRAADLDADLVIMGGYGHSRWQELVLGGATRTFLSSMTVPVLMSH